MVKPDDFEIIESYELMGERRFRLRLKKTNIVFNVAAKDEEEARKKAVELVKMLEIDKVLPQLREIFES